MAVDPTQMMGGVAPPQGVSNTQTMAPPQVQGGAPMDPAAMMQAPPQEPPPKPPSLVPTDVARLLAEALNNVKIEAAQGLSNYLGDPRGTVNVKDIDMLKLWRKRNPDIEPLYEKLVLGKSDEEIMMAMYPARRALIRVGRRTYTEQVQFAEKMNRMDHDPRFADLETVDEDEAEDDDYIPPQSKFPSRGQETYRADTIKKREEAEAKEQEEEERLPMEG